MLGYTHVKILRDDQVPDFLFGLDPEEWEKRHHSFRVIVEMVFALVKRYRLAKEVCRLSVEKHVLALKVIYQLTNRIYKNYHLRYFSPAQFAPFNNLDLVEEINLPVFGPNNSGEEEEEVELMFQGIVHEIRAMQTN